MFPGSGRPTYSNHAPPEGPPPSSFAPPGYPPQRSYESPPAPPPHQFSTPYGQQDPLSNGGGYSRPSNPPPQMLSGSRGNFQAPSGPPPTAPQSFGQNTGAQFQYSNCTGEKKALLVGINYMGTSNELRGCINDVKNMANFLVSRWGYKWENMVVLTDDQREMARRPYKQNIYRAMEWLVKDAKPNDSLVFHYSGHGGVTKDLDGDEESGYDDVIYPVDFEQAGHIVDDEMHDIMVRRLPPGCRLTALYDSCHSGTALDLPYVYSTKGVVKEPNLLKDAGQGALTAFMQYESGNIFGAMSSIGGLIKKASGSGADRNQVIQVKASPADVISISGCKDDQTSADARENGQSTGAMSWSFIKVMNDMPNQSYLSLLNNMRYLLKQKYSQKPQLSTSHPQDLNLAFIM